jgi:hypothetical protein
MRIPLDVDKLFIVGDTVRDCKETCRCGERLRVKPGRENLTHHVQTVEGDCFFIG